LAIPEYLATIAPKVCYSRGMIGFPAEAATIIGITGVAIVAGFALFYSVLPKNMERKDQV